MKATAINDYMDELTGGEQYDVIAVIETERAINGMLVVIADNDQKDFGTYSTFFFKDITL